jgi:hypothetical protein
MNKRELIIQMFEELKPYYPDNVDDDGVIIDDDVPEYLKFHLEGEWGQQNKILAYDVSGYIFYGVTIDGNLTAWKPTGATWVIVNADILYDLMVGDDLQAKAEGRLKHVGKIRKIMNTYFDKINELS